jgi:hypothetical protein
MYSGAHTNTNTNLHDHHPRTPHPPTPPRAATNHPTSNRHRCLGEYAAAAGVAIEPAVITKALAEVPPANPSYHDSCANLFAGAPGAEALVRKRDAAMFKAFGFTSCCGQAKSPLRAPPAQHAEEEEAAAAAFCNAEKGGVGEPGHKANVEKHLKKSKPN